MGTTSDFAKSLDAATANGDGTVLHVSQSGNYALSVYGTFDGATVTWNVALEDDNREPANGFSTSDSTFTAAGGCIAQLPKGAKLWATVSNVGASTSVTATKGKTPAERA